MLLIGDRREEHEPRSALAGIVAPERVFEKLVKIRPEFLETRIAVEGFIETKEGENHVGFRFLQPVVRRAEIFRAMARDNLIAGDGEVAHDQVESRFSGVEERLQVAGVLHAVGQRVADDGDVVAGLEGELGRRLRVAQAGSSEEGNQCNASNVHEWNRVYLRVTGLW